MVPHDVRREAIRIVDMIFSANSGLQVVALLHMSLTEAVRLEDERLRIEETADEKRWKEALDAARSSIAGSEAVLHAAIAEEGRLRMEEKEARRPEDEALAALYAHARHRVGLLVTLNVKAAELSGTVAEIVAANVAPSTARPGRFAALCHNGRTISVSCSSAKLGAAPGTRVVICAWPCMRDHTASNNLETTMLGWPGTVVENVDAGCKVQLDNEPRRYSPRDNLPLPAVLVPDTWRCDTSLVVVPNSIEQLQGAHVALTLETRFEQLLACLQLATDASDGASECLDHHDTMQRAKAERKLRSALTQLREVKTKSVVCHDERVFLSITEASLMHQQSSFIRRFHTDPKANLTLCSEIATLLPNGSNRDIWDRTPSIWMNNLYMLQAANTNDIADLLFFYPDLRQRHHTIKWILDCLDQSANFARMAGDEIKEINAVVVRARVCGSDDATSEDRQRLLGVLDALIVKVVGEANLQDQRRLANTSKPYSSMWSQKLVECMHARCLVSECESNSSTPEPWKIMLSKVDEKRPDDPMWEPWANSWRVAIRLNLWKIYVHFHEQGGEREEEDRAEAHRLLMELRALLPEQQDTCPICLEPLWQNLDDIRFMRCMSRHAIHASCHNGWIAANTDIPSDFCPSCRTNLGHRVV